jgi:hypothetical protein
VNVLPPSQPGEVVRACLVGPGRQRREGLRPRTAVPEQRPAAAGNAALPPAGTGHFRIEADADFLVVGAYPPRQNFRICRTAPTTETIESIAKLCFPESDPVGVPADPSRRLWSNLGGAAKRDQRTACGADVRRAVAHDRPGFGAARAPDIGNNNAGCRAGAAAAARRGRRAGGSFRNCSPYSRTMTIAGLSRMPTLPRSSTKAHSAAIRRTTSSAVKIGRRGGASSVMGEKSATCVAALSKLTEKWCG